MAGNNGESTLPNEQRLLEALSGQPELAINLAAKVLEAVETHRQDLLWHLGTLTTEAEHGDSPVDRLLYASPRERLPIARDMLRPLDEETKTPGLQNIAELRRTLHVWLQYSHLSETSIAKGLYIHRHTLRYRLNKLRELFPSDKEFCQSQLDDPEMRLGLLLALRVTDGPLPSPQ